ncbi:hypothetical protein FB446DRAFT_469048 [Lentinula raphanica]|nr:hypothetical protein C8R42DRAFT_717034 [Lentinula raphanica]KAJ3765385.1 hypothetical protein FB446DRAFT_469048 [Lentinula raphanica]KAJ3822174.1 hypothetical protein F5880DRAFT_1614035 [Lentinula raphanica]
MRFTFAYLFVGLLAFTYARPMPLPLDDTVNGAKSESADPASVPKKVRFAENVVSILPQIYERPESPESKTVSHLVEDTRTSESSAAAKPTTI